MTFVKGATTWSQLSQKLTQLICGEIADDHATTVASGDRWVREQSRTVTDGVLNSTTTVTSATAAFTASDVGSDIIGAGIPVGAVISSVTNSTTVVISAAATASTSGVTIFIALGSVKTPSANDLSLPGMSNRSGYFALRSWVGVTNALLDGSNPSAFGYSSVCKVNVPFTSDPSTSGFHRWIAFINCTTANTTAGDYSTARFSILVYDADSGTLITNLTNQQTSSAGVWTSSTSGFKFAVNNPVDGIIRVNTYWTRGFTATYMYGIDQWPMMARRSTTPSFSVAPSGSSGTDYDIVEQQMPANVFQQVTAERGGYFQGLGIKTATGNSGALYTASWSVSLMKARIFQTGSAGNGILGLDFGGRSAVDTVNSNVIRQPKIRTLTWIRAFQTAGSVLSSSPVNYWMSVTATGVGLVLQGDPGATGKMGAAWLGTFTPYDTTYDVLPTCFNQGMVDYTSNQPGTDHAISAEFGHNALVRRQDGSESRDWQTGWMRCDDSPTVSSSNSYWSGAQQADSSSTTSTILGSLTTLNVGNIATDTQAAQNTQGGGIAPPRQVKPAIDGYWWMYAPVYSEEGPVTSSSVDEFAGVRGYQNTRYLFIPDAGWASGDELTDTVGGTKYLLVQPDYPSMIQRIRTGTSVYGGGLALAEL